MSQPCQGGETQAGGSQSDLNQDQKLELIERQLKVLLDEVHELREERAESGPTKPEDQE
ncbi:hypothetical protein D9M68_923450 [compost metagenome]|uniref:hypothetical protein n=1 Tax=Metapseudomonas resinovorans TaxID=53412 RepID=UPI000F9E6F7A